MRAISSWKPESRGYMRTRPMGVRITALDHVHLAMARRGEARTEGFYCGVLGFEVVPKPEPQALDELVTRFRDRSVRWRWDDELAGVRRAYVDDPFGNRIALIDDAG